MKKQPMNVQTAVEYLNQQAARLTNEAERCRTAAQILGESSSFFNVSALAIEDRSTPIDIAKPKRKMSARARKLISDAQKRRWAIQRRAS